MPRTINYLAFLIVFAAPVHAGDLDFTFRKRIETGQGASQFEVVHEKTTWAADKTAVVICDMWNEHWCKGATGRVGEMAPRMNQVVNALRERGVLVIHAPSDTLDHYANTSQRKLAQSAPPVKTEIPLQGWCSLDTSKEAPLPIDDSDGGCDCVPQCEGRKAWSRQIDLIEIREGDAITDSAEAYYLMKQRGIENVIVMGVHTNMCVLGRPFSIRQMVNQGQNVVLMRDMTDTMYNPRMAPYVTHFRGTDLVVEHIEKYWAPTITSDQVIGGETFRFAGDVRPKIVVAIAEPQYGTRETLAHFARERWKQLQGFEVAILQGDPAKHDVPGLAEALQDADLLVLSARRVALPEKDARALRAYLDGGKPLIALRTSSHAFDARGQGPAGHTDWADFDAQVLGGNYQGHHPDGPVTTIAAVEGAAGHPILARIEGPFTSDASLYRAGPVASGATPLLVGRIDGAHAEPVAWTHRYGDAKVFYTSLGNPGDFANPVFQTLLDNAMRWTLE